jgi:hypothetical protein
MCAKPAIPYCPKSSPGNLAGGRTYLGLVPLSAESIDETRKYAVFGRFTASHPYSLCQTTSRLDLCQIRQKKVEAIVGLGVIDAAVSAWI